jgi:hypothetical protein
MTIRFAGARAGTRSPIQAWRCRSVTLRPANDNAIAHVDHTVLVAALRHFARHGLAAAEQAATRAHAALREGDRAGCRYWLAVCRQLDRRMADRLATTLLAHRS